MSKLDALKKRAKAQSYLNVLLEPIKDYDIIKDEIYEDLNSQPDFGQSDKLEILELIKDEIKKDDYQDEDDEVKEIIKKSANDFLLDLIDELIIKTKSK